MSRRAPSEQFSRTLSGSLPAVLVAVVAACHPQRVVLFGSLARGDERPDSDIDLLVIVDDQTDTLAASCAALRAVARLDPEVEVVVVRASMAEAAADLPGTVIRPALREGRVLYTRAA